MSDINKLLIPSSAPGAVVVKRPGLARAEGDEKEDQGGAVKQEYNYLMQMKLWTVTEERIEKLEHELADVERRLEELRRTGIEEMWDKELELFN